MRRRALAVAATFACSAMLLAGPTARTTCAAKDGLAGGEATREDLFGLTKVVTLDIEITAEEYQAMQPPMPAGGPGGPPAAPRPKRPGERESERNLFGVEFPWVRGALRSGGKTSRTVGLRYSGNASYMASAGGLKRSLKVDLNRFDPNDFHGLRALELQAGALDPTKAREALAFALFREAGVPAPRTAFAQVTLTVPGRYDKAYLGLYTLVEPVDRVFLADRFRTDQGLLLRPQGLRGVDFLGDDWDKYRGPYQSLAEPTPDQAKRLIAFARLIQQSDDRRFREEISSYLDTDKFLRFMAVQALVANADGFFTLAYNYSLFLDPGTNRFIFIPGDQELAFANFLMMGSADQLMDMSLSRPYGGENRLADRLLAIEDVRTSYRKIVEELSSTVFRKDRLLADSAAIEGATRAPLAREAAARAERAEPPVGFGPPGAPSAPDLKTFAERRSSSIADQLAGKKEGYRPRFNFGPPRGGPPPKPVDDQTISEVVKAPPGFKVSLFAAPPRVGYPVAVSVAPDGAVYVAVDEQGSLGRTPGGGRVVRCLDDDGDGKADRVNVFAKMEHPRGVIAQDGMVWVLHPPFLSVFRDEDGDGTSDRQDVLVYGLTTSLIDERGGDHTTNGIRMGIDGWIYIAVGDYGFHGAKGKDGTTLSQRGGGILRVRPNGSELEVYAIGLRNPFAIAIDPFLNLFTRDNTNDGAGWDVRVSHLIQTADYGYSQRFANFPDEIMPPLGAYGQGGGTGALSLHDERWPEAYRGALLTGDWGRSEVYRHELKPAGASFRADQTVFLTIPRPTGMDIGADGRLYVASWRGGEAAVYVGPQVGFLACVAPPGWSPASPGDPKRLAPAELIDGLCGANAAARFHCQREILRRGPSPETTRALTGLASDVSKPLYGRVAALFALKQIDGSGSHGVLRKLAGDEAVREFALRALADRKTERDGVEAAPFRAALADPSPRVRAQALIALGRLGDVGAAPGIIPLTARPEGSPMPTTSPVNAQPDPDRAVPHLALRALVSLRAIDACLDAVDGPHRDGALRALRSMHDPKAVEGVIKKLSTARSPQARRDILATLVRLYHREADYDGSWWGIRPDTTGPYFDPREWESSGRIASVLKAAVLDGDAETTTFLRGEMARRRVRLKGLPADAMADRAKAEEEVRVIIAKADPKNADQIGNMPYEAAARRVLQAKGSAERGKSLFAGQSCRACHTDADGQTPKGPHLVDIGKRYSPAELVESMLRPSVKIAQGYEAYSFAMADGRVFTGFVVSEGASTVQVRESSGALRELKRSDIEERRRQETSVMPEGIVANLTPEGLADLVAYLRSLDPSREIRTDR
ncbi:MAG: CotH kinase family protein [Isosphaeraceae bacterium]|nr:CotH kinase family protein [Isosphaeraceae bacterium]